MGPNKAQREHAKRQADTAASRRAQAEREQQTTDATVREQETVNAPFGRGGDNATRAASDLPTYPERTGGAGTPADDTQADKLPDHNRPGVGQVPGSEGGNSTT